MLLLTLLISEITQSCLPDLQAPQILDLAKDISKGSAATKDMEIGLNFKPYRNRQIYCGTKSKNEVLATIMCKSSPRSAKGLDKNCTKSRRQHAVRTCESASLFKHSVVKQTCLVFPTLSDSHSRHSHIFRACLAEVFGCFLNKRFSYTFQPDFAMLCEKRCLAKLIYNLCYTWVHCLPSNAGLSLAVWSLLWCLLHFPRKSLLPSGCHWFEFGPFPKVPAWSLAESDLYVCSSLTAAVVGFGCSCGCCGCASADPVKKEPDQTEDFRSVKIGELS